MASLALATTFVSKSIFNSEENGFTNKADGGDDDYAPTYCFMAKGAKVLKYPSSESSEDECDENLKPSYSKLPKIAVRQQKAFEKVQNMQDLEQLRVSYEDLQMARDSLCRWETTPM